MFAYAVPGLSVAIAKDGRLVYVDAFGLASRDGNEPLTSRHVFRIASVTKPLTSAAVFLLAEHGKLRLSDRVFGSGGILGNDYGPLSDKPYLGEVTVEHLLTHTAGGWRNDGSDPMFRLPQLSQRELIAWTLANLPLANPPGGVYAYSNFGYCALGRIIEKIAGIAYATFVAREILAPCGIADMRIAGNTLAERVPNEVVYHGQDGDNPYGLNVARMDSHGGWLATPTDLVRFAVRLSVTAGRPALLQPPTVALMTTASQANPGYAKGWLVNQQGNWWHNGSLPGSTTILVRTRSGFCWAALANSRRRNSDIGLALDRLIWTMAAKVTVWPAGDLFG